ncbi:MAG: hypothetical protein M1821_008915 [Bathelium mastoideum]|nr:MAG: hypothetical protein M1821_008915 [Bathelium mastoideum]
MSRLTTTPVGKRRKLNPADDDDNDYLIIALDFGTTYSGIAYAFSTKPDQVYSINEWPGAPGRTVPKTPTALKYDSQSSFKWGYELDRTAGNKIEGIKLLLDPDQDRPLYDPTTIAGAGAEIELLGNPPIDVAAAYMGAIYQYALKKIEGKVPKSYLEMLDKRFVLSVPAVWSEKAKDTTLRTARNAGIAPIELIKEPEAAALFTLHNLKNQGLVEGDAITVCDAGGGTVDLVSYEILRLSPLELKELVPSTGGIAGSRIINKRFEQWIKDTVGERVHLDLKETNGYRLAMKQFEETLKPAFRSENDEDQFVSFPMAQIPDNRAKGIKANTLTLTGRDLKGIFDPVFKDIDRLVGGQIIKVQIKRMQERHPKGAHVKAVFLVGGFGSNLYLRDALATAHPGTQVIQPNDAWSAIVQGAVLSKLPKGASVVSSVAEKHYGVCAGSRWDSVRDKGRECEKYWDEYEEVYRCTVMKWYIHKVIDSTRLY